MKHCSGLWRRALGRALFISTTLTATPVVACAGPSVDELAARLPGGSLAGAAPAGRPDRLSHRARP